MLYCMSNDSYGVCVFVCVESLTLRIFSVSETGRTFVANRAAVVDENLLLLCGNELYGVCVCVCVCVYLMSSSVRVVFILRASTSAVAPSSPRPL